MRLGDGMGGSLYRVPEAKVHSQDHEKLRSMAVGEVGLEKEMATHSSTLAWRIPLQYSCLENPLDRGAWWATVHGVTELNTTE